MNAHLHSELDTLLALRAACGLSASESERLESLLAAEPSAEHDGFDRAAAALMLALDRGTSQMPETLQRQLRIAGDEWCERQPEPAGEPQQSVDEGVERNHNLVAFPERRGSAPAWAVAAMALLVAALGWFPAFRGAVSPDTSSELNGPTPAAAELSPFDAREALLVAGTDVVTIEWTATDDPTASAATGDVVWSAAEQRGFMRFAGLVPNDANEFQYQLWIFDSARDERYPVDGGVFDILENGEVVVPILPTLPVTDATLFAVTVERPGGVMVSSRERINLVASVVAP
ncbi:MAG: hypothetical protein GKS06_11490 [Acidobacteria bacterium]|nr:hypothetical protein [Acidobacteriota bacterium]